MSIPAAPTPGLTAREENLLIGLLGQISGTWSRRLAEAVLREVPVLAIEAVILRRRPDGRVEVVLTERPSDDIHWKDKLAVPGTGTRKADLPVPGDRLFESQLRRLETEELGVPFATARLIGLYEYGRSGAEGGGGRCNTIQVVHLCTLDREPTHGGWYPVDDLPPAFLATQQHLIDMAVTAFGAQD